MVNIFYDTDERSEGNDYSSINNRTMLQIGMSCRDCDNEQHVKPVIVLKFSLTNRRPVQQAIYCMYKQKSPKVKFD